MLFCVAVSAQKKKTASDARFVGLDAQLNQFLTDWQIVGFSVAVVEKDKIVYSKGFGYRDVDKKLPVDGNTLFAIGSCSKAFTATLIGQLANEGKLDLDKPVTSYYANLKFYNDNMNNIITARDMLSHKTGLPRHDYSWYFFPSDSRDSLVKRIQFMEPTATVREKWQYNNFMYLALGEIDEQLTGKTWETNIKEKIFAPLGMTRSNLTIKDLAADPNASLGYGLKKDSIVKKMEYYNISGMGPAGAIHSSVNEMANWVITWLNDGKFNGKEVIPASFRAEAVSSQAIIDGALPSKEIPGLHFSNYGFGWMLASYKGHYRVEHGGNIDGFSANTAFFPTDSIGIIVLTNQNASFAPGLIRNTIADKVLGLKFYDWSDFMKKRLAKAKITKDATENKEATKTEKPATHDLKDYIGNYNNPGYGTIKIYLEANELYFNGAGKKIQLKHKTYDAFAVVEVDASGNEDPSDPNDPVPVGQFNLNESGDIDNFSVPFEAGAKPIEFKKQLEEKILAKDELQKYTGEYELSGQTIKVYIKNDRNLFVLVPGQPEYELAAIEKDKFGLKTVSGYFVQFNLDEKGNGKELTFIQPNGNFTAKRK